VVESERHLAFNTQPLRSRVAIVAAGPLANLLLAVILYSIVNWAGVLQAAPILASPEAGSIAERAGLVGGEQVQRAAFDDEEFQVVQSFEDLRWFLTRGALEARDVRLELTGLGGKSSGEKLLKLRGLEAAEANAELFRKIGLTGPYTRPVLGEVVAGGAADRAGLLDGDLVRQVGSVSIVDGQQLRQLIRASVVNGGAKAEVWKIDRSGALLDLTVEPEAKQDGANVIGKIGAYVGTMPVLVDVQYGLLDGAWRGFVRTWDVSALTLRMMVKMVVGEASLKNLSGPLTIADYAGKSAGLGLTQYLLFLALISVSLGVLNLLPLPVLDGGHLMYYLWEGVTGKPVSDVWMDRMQRVGVAFLMLMMSIALFNDVTRLFG
jgi:regulator of sigma E protease